MIIVKRVIFRENSFESLRGSNYEKLGVEFVSDQKEAKISSQRFGKGIGQVLNIVCREESLECLGGNNDERFEEKMLKNYSDNFLKVLQ